jgi:hypothetical protein
MAFEYETAGDINKKKFILIPPGDPLRTTYKFDSTLEIHKSLRAVHLNV